MKSALASRRSRQSSKEDDPSGMSDLCVPISISSCDTGTNIINANSCEKYFVLNCDANIIQLNEILCPPGTLFDHKIGVCVHSNQNKVCDRRNPRARCNEALAISATKKPVTLTRRVTAHVTSHQTTQGKEETLTSVDTSRLTSHHVTPEITVTLTSRVTRKVTSHRVTPGRKSTVPIGVTSPSIPDQVTPISTLVGTTICNAEGSLPCNRGDTFIDPTDCYSWYQCTSWMKLEKLTCAKGSAYNHLKKIPGCVTEQEVIQDGLICDIQRPELRCNDEPWTPIFITTVPTTTQTTSPTIATTRVKTTPRKTTSVTSTTSPTTTHPSTKVTTKAAPTPSTPFTAPQSSSSAIDNNVLIAVVVVGALIFLAIAALVIVLACRRRRKKSNEAVNPVMNPEYDFADSVIIGQGQQIMAPTIDGYPLSSIIGGYPNRMVVDAQKTSSMSSVQRLIGPSTMYGIYDSNTAETENDYEQLPLPDLLGSGNIARVPSEVFDVPDVPDVPDRYSTLTLPSERLVLAERQYETLRQVSSNADTPGQSDSDTGMTVSCEETPSDYLPVWPVHEA